MHSEDVKADQTKDWSHVEICKVNSIELESLYLNFIKKFYFKSFDEAINLVLTKYATRVESIFAIGGAQIYKHALTYPYGFLNKLYLTRVYSDTDCDVFLEPKEFLQTFEKLTNVDANIYDEQFNKIFHDDTYNLEYCFEVYEKRKDFI